MRSPVTLVIQQFNSLTEDEKKLCLDFIAPEPEQEVPVKKLRKKRTPRIGLPEATKDPKADTSKTEGQLCTAIVPGLGVVCGEAEDRLIHDPNGGYGGYHPFSVVALTVAPKSSRKSRSTKAAESSTPTSGTVAGRCWECSPRGEQERKRRRLRSKT